jgi:hypothetical protein
MGKVKLTLTFEDEVIKKARKLGLNHYQVAENGFIDIIGRIEGRANLIAQILPLTLLLKKGY